MVMFGLIAIGTSYVKSGNATVETGVVTRIKYLPKGGGAAAFIRMSNGGTLELLASVRTLQGCAPGKPIQLVRQGNVRKPAPLACQSS
jgi:hypothetical protein